MMCRQCVCMCVVQICNDDIYIWGWMCCDSFQEFIFPFHPSSSSTAHTLTHTNTVKQRIWHSCQTSHPSLAWQVERFTSQIKRKMSGEWQQRERVCVHVCVCEMKWERFCADQNPSIWWTRDRIWWEWGVKCAIKMNVTWYYDDRIRNILSLSVCMYVYVCSTICHYTFDITLLCY